MPRKTPYSGKAKKVQLQEKRRKKQEKEERKRHDFGVPSEPSNVIPVVPSFPTTGSSVLPLSSVTSDRSPRTPRSDSGRLRSKFFIESKAAVDQRREDAQQAFRNRVFEQGVAYEHWWDITSSSGPEKMPRSIVFPTRPDWDDHDDKYTLEEKEELEMWRWLYKVARKYTTPTTISVNHFETNIEVWRQLWRVLEGSDVVILVADARHPIFHIPMALVQHVRDELAKSLIIVLNKIDLVPADVLAGWKAYLAKWLPDIPVHEFTCFPNDESVTLELNTGQFRKKKQRQKATKINYNEYVRKSGRDDEAGDEDDEEDEEEDEEEEDEEEGEGQGEVQEMFQGQRKMESEEKRQEHAHIDREKVGGYIQSILRTAQEEYRKRGGKQEVVTLGMVGHPNVGKSSLINALAGEKVVSVSATAGHTKHLQHIPLSPELRLCDCPGLTFPYANIPISIQVIMGTYPLAQNREPYTAVAYLAERLPLERIYGLKKPRSFDSDDPWSGYMVAEAMAEKKGYYIKRGKGLPNAHRGGQEIIKEAVSGQLVLFFRPPPESTIAELQEVDRLADVDIPEGYNLASMSAVGYYSTSSSCASSEVSMDGQDERVHRRRHHHRLHRHISHDEAVGESVRSPSNAVPELGSVSDEADEDTTPSVGNMFAAIAKKKKKRGGR
eukprot:Sspe_Gene.38861::Locus_18739_Transcript_1_4_Confidence_0.333_Length_2095::g.38861::m.38861